MALSSVGGNTTHITGSFVPLNPYVSIYIYIPSIGTLATASVA